MDIFRERKLMTEKLPMFVYGILKPEINGISRYARALVAGHEDVVHGYCIYDRGIAFAYKKPGGKVIGFLWYLDELSDVHYMRALATLDRLEAGYTRVVVTTESGAKAWMYTVSHSIIPKGSECVSAWPSKKGLGKYRGGI